ncbi:MAG: ABC transporter ATP-binding protein [Microthrixaceae bacterium]
MSAPVSGTGAGISLHDVTITYEGAPGPTLSEVNLEVPEGELCLVIGSTGSGKSTLLGAINGLVPHFTGGTLAGEVVVAGRRTSENKPRDLADAVGVVGQDPLAGFVTDVVEDELAYSMEQLGVPPTAMRKRVEETLDLLGLAELRTRALADLSGGQQQRVAIGAALTAQPRILVLDEPTSALDPTAAEDVLAAITRLVHDLGITVVMAEHRLERVIQYADMAVTLDPLDRGEAAGVVSHTVSVGTVDERLAHSDLAPPVVQLARVAGWEGPVLSVRQARRSGGELRSRLEGLDPHLFATDIAQDAPPGLVARDVVVRHGHRGEVVAVRGVDLDVSTGRVCALMGRNGSGKSSLLWALAGTGARQGGSVDIGGVDPRDVPRGEARRLVTLVPQSPADLLYLTTVDAECERADGESGAAEGTTRGWLERLVGVVPGAANPRDLSEGQRLALALAVQVAPDPEVVLLDEPTRGLDHQAKERFGAALGELCSRGRTVLVATHDVEFVARWAHDVVLMAQGEVIANGPADEVIASSAAFAPQVAKVMYPQRWLTVDEVSRALARVRDTGSAGVR